MYVQLHDRSVVGQSDLEGRWRKHGGRSTRREKLGGKLWREIWRKNRHLEVKRVDVIVYNKYYFDYDRSVVG